jgi:Holliday junction resolvase
VKKYEREKWEVIKLLKTNKNGYPDLLLLKPNEVRFVEVKALKGRLSKIQEYRIKDLRSKGFPVEVVRSPD